MSKVKPFLLFDEVNLSTCINIFLEYALPNYSMRALKNLCMQSSDANIPPILAQVSRSNPHSFLYKFQMLLIILYRFIRGLTI